MLQDGARTLQQLRDIGESEAVTGAVYFPPDDIMPGAALAFSQVQTGDHIETPMGSGRVEKVLYSSGALAVSVTQSQTAPPPRLVA